MAATDWIPILGLETPHERNLSSTLTVALIRGNTMINVLISLIIYLIIVGVIYWAVTTILVPFGTSRGFSRM